jgi:hypothetical protein
MSAAKLANMKQGRPSKTVQISTVVSAEDAADMFCPRKQAILAMQWPNQTQQSQWRPADRSSHCDTFKRDEN